MKKLKAAFALTICAFATLVVINSCKKESAASKLIGTWSNDDNTGLFIQRSTYQFNDDGTMEFTAIGIDSVSKQIVGYTLKLTGKYSFDGSTIKFSQIIANNGLTPFTALVALVQFPGATADPSLQIKFNTNKDFTVIPPPCPANANCLAWSNYVYVKL